MATHKSRLTQDQFDAIARAVADPRRFAILQQVAAKSCTPCSSLSEHDCISPATISHHLKELSEAGLIDIVREGRTAQLTLRRDTWQSYLDQLATL
jgi:ArsR family transcriptional regulator